MTIQKTKKEPPKKGTLAWRTWMHQRIDHTRIESHRKALEDELKSATTFTREDVIRRFGKWFGVSLETETKKESEQRRNTECVWE